MTTYSVVEDRGEVLYFDDPRAEFGTHGGRDAAGRWTEYSDAAWLEIDALHAEEDGHHVQALALRRKATRIRARRDS